MYEPFKVVFTHNNAYELQLPSGFDAHLTFNVKLLRKDLNNSLPDQNNLEPPPVRVNDYDEWLIKHILASHCYCCCLEYCVKWVGFENNSGWYSAEFFEHAQEKVQEFHTQHSHSPHSQVVPPASVPKRELLQQFAGVHISLLPEAAPEICCSCQVAGLPANVQH